MAMGAKGNAMVRTKPDFDGEESPSTWWNIKENAVKVRNVQELKAKTPRPIAARIDRNDLDLDALRDLLLEEDNTLEHLFLESPFLRMDGNMKGFFEAAFSKLSSLQLPLGDIALPSINAAILALEQKRLPIKLRALWAYESMSLQTLSESELRKHLEHLMVLLFPGSTEEQMASLNRLLEDPACKIWDLHLNLLPIRTLPDPLKVLCNIITDRLCRVLRSPFCKLQSLSVLVELDINFTEALLGPILSTLEANYNSQIRMGNMEEVSEVLKERWLRVKHRNTLFCESTTLKERPPAKPSTSKLVMCGHTGSGKTC